MKDFKGVIIAEGLKNPTTINKFIICKAEITKDDMPIDYEGHLGRWHIYYVMCSEEEINKLQPRVLKGWYAHFWKDNSIIVVYSDRKFELLKDDKSTWEEAIEHGRAQGIPGNELDFPTD